MEFLYGGGGEALVSMKKLPVKIECYIVLFIKNIRHIGESWGDFLYGKKVSWYHYFIDIVNLFLIVRCGNGPICKSGK